jgi:hypothetical protein
MGLYEDCVVNLAGDSTIIDIVNGKMSDEMVLSFAEEGNWQVTTYNCMGEIQEEFCICDARKIELIKVSPNGLLKLRKILN